MAMSSMEQRLDAIERYQHSVRQARLRDRWAQFTGRSASVLRYEAVAARLHIRQQIPTGYQMVPLHKIVGSVGRYREFTTGFFPRAEVMQDRWVAVDITMNSLAGLPPVELYQVGEGYFVIDGNHRISVARANGNQDIEAFVLECQTPVHLTLSDFAGEGWVAKAAYADFMIATQLDELRPTAQLTTSDGAHYATLLQHIAVHRYLANKPPRFAGDARGEMSWREAVASWYDNVYMPLVEAIRAHNLTRRFPKRTETDLYVAITQYREQVAERFELAPLSAAISVAVFAANHGDRLIDRAWLTLRDRIAAKARWYHVGVEMPAGMAAAEFAALRLRHDAGELSLIEAERRYGAQPCFGDALCEPHLSAQLA